jgi:outer membrane protein assembly factor BamE (lipoprotein component of BamABCDE complex)
MRPALFASIGAITLCLLLFACSTTRKLKNLSVGMTAAEVVSIIGEPEIAREPMTNKYGQVIELWHYELYNNRADAYQPYFLYFYEGRLAKWGKATNLPRKKIYNMKFDGGGESPYETTK